MQLAVVLKKLCATLRRASTAFKNNDEYCNYDETNPLALPQFTLTARVVGTRRDGDGL
jgi:hypothetical protein